MHELINENGWVWVFVQDPGKDEQFVGQYFEQEDISFIPAFVDKEEALKCQGRMALDQDRKYEAQAIHFEDLIHQASKNGFVVFLVDGQGKIIDNLTP